MKNQAVLSGGGNIFTIAFAVVLRAMLITAAALILLTLFISYGNVSDEVVSSCITAATFISVFAAGFMCGRKRSRSGWLSGLVAGGIYVLFMLLSGLIIFGDFGISWDTLKMFVLSALGSVVGGIFGVNFRKKRK